MSHKVLCPVCNSYTSSVAEALSHDEPCPHCGTPASIIAEVNVLREQRGDLLLKQRAEALLIELGKVTAERDRLRSIVSAIHIAMDRYEQDR